MHVAYAAPIAIDADINAFCANIFGLIINIIYIRILRN